MKTVLIILALCAVPSLQAALLQRDETAQALNANPLTWQAGRQTAASADGNPDADRSAVQELAKKKKKKKKASSKASY
jgi:hypothetical protein